MCGHLPGGTSVKQGTTLSVSALYVDEQRKREAFLLGSLRPRGGRGVYQGAEQQERAIEVLSDIEKEYEEPGLYHRWLYSIHTKKCKMPSYFTRHRIYSGIAGNCNSRQASYSKTHRQVQQTRKET